MNLSHIWQQALGTMRHQTSRQEYDSCLKWTSLLALENGLATIGTNSFQHKESLENRYMGPIRQLLGDIVGFPVQVRVVIAQGAAARTDPLPLGWDDGAEGEVARVHAAAPERTAAPSPPAHIGSNGGGPAVRPASNGTGSHTDGSVVQLDLVSALRGMLNPRYSFDRFIVGSSNRMAHAACMAVAEHPAQAYNPLFLYGGVGLGKTHLLHAIGNYALERDPEINVMYVSSEKFTNDLINAIRRQQTDEFRIRYRNIDILLIDDIQFIAGKESTQEEFFHTFNTLHSAAKQIVISSDRPPKAIMTLEERLRSRFEWGLIVDVQPPDLETRTAILRAKGDQMQVRVPEEVVDYLAHKIQSNIRELEGCLNRVVAYANLNGLPVSIDSAAAALSDLLDNSRRKRITPDMIIHEVAAFFAIDLKTLQGRGRNRQVVVPRQVAMYLLREETDSSLMEIGDLLGGRDHTTVMYGCDKIAGEIQTDARLRKEVTTIRERIYAHGGDR